MSFPTITPLPDPPRRGASDAEAFAQDGDAFMGALPGFQGQMNTAGAYVDATLEQMQDLVQSGGFTATSTSSLVIGTGAKALTVEANRSYVPGSLISVADTAAPTTNLMLGTVTAYNATTGLLNFTVAAGDAFGAGTKTAWSISLSGPRGPSPSTANFVTTDTSQDLTGRKAAVGGVSAMATATTGLGAFEIRAGAGGAGMVEVNRNGAWRAYFGVDTDNIWKVGGGSMGAVANIVWHAGNDGSGSGLDADLVRGSAPDTAATGGTIVKRSANGDISGRAIGLTQGVSTTGNNGISWVDWATSLYMTDAVWIRVGGDKGFVTGGAIQGGTVTATSDARLKSKIRDLEPIQGLRPRRFIKDGIERLGYVAQEVQEVAPEAVHEGEVLSLEPLAMIAAVHAQLEAKIRALMSRLDDREGAE